MHGSKHWFIQGWSLQRLYLTFGTAWKQKKIVAQMLKRSGPCLEDQCSSLGLKTTCLAFALKTTGPGQENSGLKPIPEFILTALILSDNQAITLRCGNVFHPKCSSKTKLPMLGLQRVNSWSNYSPNDQAYVATMHQFYRWALGNLWWQQHTLHRVICMVNAANLSEGITRNLS